MTSKLRIDMHVHARPGTPHALSSFAEQLEAAKRKGIDCIGIVDHARVRSAWNVDEYRTLGEAMGVVVLPGTEVKTTFMPIHVFGVKMNGEDLRLDGEVEMLGLIDWAHDNGGIVIIPNLYQWIRWFGPRDDEWDFWVRKADALEDTWSITRNDSELVRRKAAKLNKRIVGGSNAHYHKQLGRGSFELEVSKRSADAVISVLREA